MFCPKCNNPNKFKVTTGLKLNSPFYKSDTPTTENYINFLCGACGYSFILSLDEIAKQLDKYFALLNQVSAICDSLKN